MVRSAGEGTPFETSLNSMGCGLAQEEVGEVYHDRQVITLKPVVRTEDGLGINFCGTVVVTANGGRRLGKRPLELMLTSRSFMRPYLNDKTREPSAPWLD